MVAAVYITGGIIINSISKKHHRENCSVKIEATIDVLQKRNAEMAAQIKNLNQADVAVADKKAAVKSLNKQKFVNLYFPDCFTYTLSVLMRA